MKPTLAFAPAALLVAACSAPAAPPETFPEWIAGLEPVGEFTSYHATFEMDMSFDLLAMAAAMPEVDLESDADGGMSMRYAMRGELDMLSQTVGRMSMDLEVDLSALGEEELEEPLEIGLLMVCDGETLYTQPEWKSEVLREELSGEGFDAMVFTVRVATLERFLEAMGGMMDAEGVFGDRPFMEVMAENMDPAAWTRNLEDYSMVTAFEVAEDQVSVEFTLSEEYWDAIATDPASEPFMEMFEDLRYTMTADLETGIPSAMSFTMTGAMSMAGEFRLEPRAADSFGPGMFVYELPADRRLFPIDQFMDLARSMMMASGDASGEDDFEF